MNAGRTVAVVVTGGFVWLAAPAFGAPAGGGAAGPASQAPREAPRGAMGGVRPAMSQTRTDETGGVRFTVAASGGEVLLVAEASGIVFEKRSTADSVSIRVAVAGDAVRIDAGRTGEVRLARSGRSRRLRVAAGSVGHVRAAQEALAGSMAMLALESLAARLAGSTMPEADSVLTSHALVEAVQGRSAATRALARRHRGRAPAAAVRSVAATRVAGSADCWGDYTAGISDAFGDYESCLTNIWWGWPVCSFEYAIRAEGLWFGFIACSGGLPV